MTSHLFIYGEIGPAQNPGVKSYTLDDFRNELDPKASEYVVHISSVGGDVFDGFTMFNLLKNSGKPVTVQIEGICASIATLIAAAGDKIKMNRTAKFMIHNPHVAGLKGESKDLRNVAEQLDKIKTILVDVYQKRTGLDYQKLSDMYDNETWMTADEAKSMGFVDEAEDSLKAVARVRLREKETMKQRSKEHDKAYSLLNAFKEALGLRPKNEMTETLEDGRVIIVMAEGEDWSGAQVTFETGEPLPAGTYTLSTGMSIVVDEGSKITQVTMEEQEQEEAPPAMDAQKEKDRADAAEQRVKELESALEQVNAKAAAEAKTHEKFRNEMSAKVTQLEETFKVLNITPAGDNSAPKQREKEIAKEPAFDGMAEMAKEFIKSRGF